MPPRQRPFEVGHLDALEIETGVPVAHRLAPVARRFLRCQRGPTSYAFRRAITLKCSPGPWGPQCPGGYVPWGQQRQIGGERRPFTMAVVTSAFSSCGHRAPPSRPQWPIAAMASPFVHTGNRCNLKVSCPAGRAEVSGGKGSGDAIGGRTIRKLI